MIPFLKDPLSFSPSLPPPPSCASTYPRRLLEGCTVTLGDTEGTQALLLKMTSSTPEQKTNNHSLSSWNSCCCGYKMPVKKVRPTLGCSPFPPVPQCAPVFMPQPGYTVPLPNMLEIQPFIHLLAHSFVLYLATVECQALGRWSLILELLG